MGQDLGPGTVTTTYTYDLANQLTSAQKDGTTWQYSYDGNGSLTEVLPGGVPASGAKRYTYNSAGFLTQVESHDGSDWNTQAAMSYNGLGQRLSMDAAGVISYYVLDGNRPLTAESGGNTTSYLYGVGAIGEKTTDWAYSLPDGVNTPRQLADPTGDITLSTRYTPWGDTLDVYGNGSFTFGYFGGVMDAATGLLYVGNGQYYDPVTGRFLTRDGSPNSTNPYVPWSPLGALIGPLGLVVLFFGRRKKGSRAGMLLVLLLVGVTVGMTLAACDRGPDDKIPEEPNIPVEPKKTQEGPGKDPGNTLTPSGTPIGTPTPSDNCIQVIAEPIEAEIRNTISSIVDYVFGAGNSIKAVSNYANRSSVESYLKRLMEESGRQSLNTNQLAYIYATAHVESGWGDFEEKYEGDPEKYFDDRYGPNSLLGPLLGNTIPGDGYRYMGRGFIHLTGRANYLRVSKELGLGTDLEDFPYKAECGKNCPYDYDYVTKIAVTGMKNGLFTGIGLLSPTISSPDGSFEFYLARAIIGWPGNSSSQQAGDLGVGFAKILSEQCPLGGVSSGILCVVCH